MFHKRAVPADHKAFEGLPVQGVTVAGGEDRVAVHVAGRLSSDRLPLVCVPDYHRNMSDFSDFIGHFHRISGDDWPVVLLDLRGRGRSTDRADKRGYISPNDAQDIAALTSALGIESAVLLGQGYGGQVVMALAVQKPALLARAVLIDAGPVSNAHGLVRLRGNLRALDGIRDEASYQAMTRRMLAADYPGTPEVKLDALALRTHFLDRRGRPRGLFDPHLLKRLEAFDHDDVLEAQWPYFEALSGGPLVMLRTQLSNQLRRETFEEMMRRRPDAEAYVIEGQGSPALLDSRDDVAPIADFVTKIGWLRTPAERSA